jgi:general nucleoside transport system permease protein
MIMLHKYKWFYSRRFYLYLFSEKMKTDVKKIKASFLCLLFALVISSFFIISKINPIFYFKEIIKYSFTGKINNVIYWDKTLLWWAIYIIAGLTILLPLKGNMFNLGTSGVILFSGTTFISIALLILKDDSRWLFLQNNKFYLIFLLFFACCLTGGLFMFLISILKIYFFIHEVVSCILINWIVWYFIKWYFISSKLSNYFYDGSNNGTKIYNSDIINLKINDYTFIVPLILAFSLIILIWIFLKKTTFGYKLNVICKNRNVAKYAGINEKKYIFFNLTLTGIISGILAFIIFMTVENGILFSNDLLPSIGFEGITISLISQNNPIALIFIAFFWSIIKTGSVSGQIYKIPIHITDLMFAITIYSTAIFSLFLKFNFWFHIKSLFYTILNKKRRKIFKLNLKKIFQLLFIKKKMKKALFLLKNLKNYINKEYQNNNKNQILKRKFLNYWREKNIIHGNYIDLYIYEKINYINEKVKEKVKEKRKELKTKFENKVNFLINKERKELTILKKNVNF